MSLDGDLLHIRREILGRFSNLAQEDGEVLAAVKVLDPGALALLVWCCSSTLNKVGQDGAPVR